MSRDVRPARSRGVPALLLFLIALSTSLEGQIFGSARARVSQASIRGHMELLAGDALNGRGSGTRDEWIAATYAGSQFRRWGLEPVGPAGAAADFVQEIRTPGGLTWNAVAQISGSDDRRRDQIVLLTAHLDHLGARGTGADTIYNGADDNASGVAAVLELARVLAASKPHDRTVMFALFGSEESGLTGSRFFADHLGGRLLSVVANLQFEMLGRPDPAIAPRMLWLTGYHRSTLGPELARRGARLVADPHPREDFFSRSDSIEFAHRGIVAQTVSSYGLHSEYHTPADDLAHIDFTHMTEAISSLVEPIEGLANSSFVPAWLPGMKPERGRR